MNEVVSNSVSAVDKPFLFISLVSLVLLVGITLVMIYFVVRYSRKKHPKAVQIHGSIKLEIIWTVLPTILVIIMFFYGYEGFKILRNVPENVFTVKAIGRMWDWTFEYENGMRTKKLYVPLDKNIEIRISSMDVIHSFYIPAFRIKEDAVPGKTNYLWFKPQTMGAADIFCAEYCGNEHAYMLSKVIVMPQDEFEKWYQAGESDTPESYLADAKNLLKVNDCLSCHSLDGSSKSGPTFKGIYRRETEVIKNNKQITLSADEDYLKRAILRPSDELVKGYGSIMMPGKHLSPREVEAIVNYLKTL